MTQPDAVEVPLFAASNASERATRSVLERAAALVRRRVFERLGRVIFDGDGDCMRF